MNLMPGLIYNSKLLNDGQWLWNINVFHVSTQMLHLIAGEGKNKKSCNRGGSFSKRTLVHLGTKMDHLDTKVYLFVLL